MTGTRSIAAATLTEAQSASNIPIVLVKLEFDSGDLRLHSHIGDLTYNSETYTGAGDFAYVGPVTEDSDFQRNYIEIGLRGIPSSIITIALTEEYQGRPATVYFGFLDQTTRVLVGTPLPYYGTMDYPTISYPTDCQITLKVEDEFADLDMPIIRRYNDSDQQSEYSGDKFFEFAEATADKQIHWGQKNPKEKETST